MNFIFLKGLLNSLLQQNIAKIYEEESARGIFKWTETKSFWNRTLEATVANIVARDRRRHVVIDGHDSNTENVWVRLRICHRFPIYSRKYKH